MTTSTPLGFTLRRNTLTLVDPKLADTDVAAKHFGPHPVNAQWHVYETRRDTPVRIRDFPIGSIVRNQTAFPHTNKNGLAIRFQPGEIYVDAHNYYCNQLPVGKEYEFYVDSTVTKLQIIWSDHKAIPTFRALKAYNLLPTAKNAVYINSKGVRVTGYRVIDLVKKAIPSKFLPPNPTSYTSQDLETINTWKNENRLYTLSGICKDDPILVKILRASSQVIKQKDPDKFSTVTAYTCLTLEEHLRLPEFWDNMLSLYSGLATILGTLTDEGVRNEMFNALATRLLTGKK